MAEASRRPTGRCGSPWRTSLTRLTRISGAACGRSRAGIAMHSNWRGPQLRGRHSCEAWSRASVGRAHRGLGRGLSRPATQEDTPMMQTLRVSPELGVFLAVGVGYWLGQLKLGSFSVGPVTAALICGLVVGNFWEEPTRDFRTAFFLLFLFANGYAAGPQFISGLRSGGIKPLILAIFVCTTGLVTTVLIARSLGLDAGIAAGLFSGSMTASAAIGTATDAIKSLPLSSEAAATLVSHVVIADALCYIFGAVGVIWFVSSIAPRLLRINLREEARALERELGIDNRDVGVFSARRPFAARSFHLKP